MGAEEIKPTEGMPRWAFFALPGMKVHFLHGPEGDSPLADAVKAGTVATIMEIHTSVGVDMVSIAMTVLLDSGAQVLVHADALELEGGRQPPVFVTGNEGGVPHNDRIYDLEVAPKLAELYRVCVRHSLPMIAVFQYAPEGFAFCKALSEAASARLKRALALAEEGIKLVDRSEGSPRGQG